MRHLIAVFLSVFAAGSAMAETRLTIMTFNMWGAGANEDKPIDETVAVLKASGADIIGVQETRLEGPNCTADLCPPLGESRAPELATALGYYYVDQTVENAANWSNAILSRYPIGETSPNGLGVAINVAGRQVWAFNIHLDDSPYQPYQLLDIEYGNAPFFKTEAEAITAASATRGEALALLKADMVVAEGADAALIFGDFNEPSFRDWTVAAVAAGNVPIKVEFPMTKAIEAMGFIDALRAVYPDEVTKTAYTWTPFGDPEAADDHQDRIDFVFVRGPSVRITGVAVLGEAEGVADVVVEPWPSDHRAIAATIVF